MGEEVGVGKGRVNRKCTWNACECEEAPLPP